MPGDEPGGEETGLSASARLAPCRRASALACVETCRRPGGSAAARPRPARRRTGRRTRRLREEAAVSRSSAPQENLRGACLEELPRGARLASITSAACCSPASLYRLLPLANRLRNFRLASALPAAVSSSSDVVAGVILGCLQILATTSLLLFTSSSLLLFRSSSFLIFSSSSCLRLRSASFLLSLGRREDGVKACPSGVRPAGTESQGPSGPRPATVALACVSTSRLVLPPPRLLLVLRLLVLVG